MTMNLKAIRERLEAIKTIITISDSSKLPSKIELDCALEELDAVGSDLFSVVEKQRDIINDCVLLLDRLYSPLEEINLSCRTKETSREKNGYRSGAEIRGNTEHKILKSADLEKGFRQERDTKRLRRQGGMIPQDTRLEWLLDRLFSMAKSRSPQLALVVKLNWKNDLYTDIIRIIRSRMLSSGSAQLVMDSFIERIELLFDITPVVRKAQEALKLTEEKP